jgi:hypothetical protein
MKNPNVHRASFLLLLLLSADFVSNGLHIVKHILIAPSSLIDVRISAYLGIYHFVKLFWIIILFVYLFRSTRCFGYISWILIFSFFLIDDTLYLHQNIGNYLGNHLGAFFPHFHLPSRAYELIVLGISGLFLNAVLAFAYRFSTDMFRKTSRRILLFILVLIIFGLIVDMAAVFNPGPVIWLVLDILEDAGEMVVFTLILWYVFLMALHDGKPGLSEKVTLTSSYEIK